MSHNKRAHLDNHLDEHRLDLIWELFMGMDNSKLTDEWVLVGEIITSRKVDSYKNITEFKESHK